MANVLGTGPVAITTKAGAHTIIPLSALTYNNDGSVSINSWPKGGSAEDNVDDIKTANDWIAYLVAQEDLKAAPVPATPPSGPAFLVEAVNPGVLGGQIKVTVSAVIDATPANLATMDFEVDITDAYVGLTVATMADIVGIDPAIGSKPGLVRLQAAPVHMPDATPAGAPIAFAGAPPQAAVPAAPADGGNAFTLVAAPNDGGADITFTVEIAGVDLVANPATFNMTVHWHRKVVGKTLADHQAAFASVVKILEPPGGFRVPAAVGPLPLDAGTDPLPTIEPAKPATKSFAPA